MDSEQPANKFLTASNVISLLRLALTVPVVLTLLNRQFLAAFILCWIGAFSDWLDGYVARKTNTVSEWGKIIDPVADKVLVGAVVVMMFVQNLLPAWFVIVVIARDLVIMAGAAVARKRMKTVLPSLMSGKLAVSAIALTGVVAMVTDGIVRDGLIVLSCGLMALSLWDYAKRLHGLLR